MGSPEFKCDMPMPAAFRWYGGAEIAVNRYTTRLWAIRDLTWAYFGSTNDTPVTR